MVWQATYGTFGFGPQVDGIFVPTQPAKLLANGSFAKNVKIMVGHNLNEGLIFAPFLYGTNAGFVQYLQTTFPRASSDVINYITNTLYPPVFDGSQGYTDNIARLALMAGEVFFTCNVDYLSKAYNGTDYSYYFTVGSGLHAADVPYTVCFAYVLIFFLTCSFCHHRMTTIADVPFPPLYSFIMAVTTCLPWHYRTGSLPSPKPACLQHLTCPALQHS